MLSATEIELSAACVTAAPASWSLASPAVSVTELTESVDWIVAVSGDPPASIVICSPAARLEASATVIVVSPAVAALLSVVLTAGPAPAVRLVKIWPVAAAVSVVAVFPVAAAVSVSLTAGPTAELSVVGVVPTASALRVVETGPLTAPVSVVSGDVDQARRAGRDVALVEELRRRVEVGQAGRVWTSAARAS